MQLSSWVIGPAPALFPGHLPLCFFWPHTWPLNHPKKREKAWYNSYIIKPQDKLDHDTCVDLVPGNVPVPSVFHSNVPAPFGLSHIWQVLTTLPPLKCQGLLSTWLQWCTQKLRHTRHYTSISSHSKQYMVNLSSSHQEMARALARHSCSKLLWSHQRRLGPTYL